MRRTVDLFLAEPLEELLVAAARLQQGHHLEPTLTYWTRRWPGWVIH